MNNPGLGLHDALRRGDYLYLGFRQSGSVRNSWGITSGLGERRRAPAACARRPRCRASSPDCAAGPPDGRWPAPECRRRNAPSARSVASEALVPSRVCAATRPRQQISRGCRMASCRFRCGSQACTSAAWGSRLLGGRHFRMLQMKTSSRAKPMAARILVSSWPLRPTKGSPCRSSSRPGASPMRTRSASGLPAPKTVCLRPSCSGQAVQGRTSSRSAARAAALSPPWLLQQRIAGARPARPVGARVRSISARVSWTKAVALAQKLVLGRRRLQLGLAAAGADSTAAGTAWDSGTGPPGSRYQAWPSASLCRSQRTRSAINSRRLFGGTAHEASRRQAAAGFPAARSALGSEALAQSSPWRPSKHDRMVAVAEARAGGGGIVGHDEVQPLGLQLGRRRGRPGRRSPGRSRPPSGRAARCRGTTSPRMSRIAHQGQLPGLAQVLLLELARRGSAGREVGHRGGHDQPVGALLEGLAHGGGHLPGRFHGHQAGQPPGRIC